MKIAYLILAHNTPNHMQKLISSLSSDSSTFFIHIDKKSNIKDFNKIVGNNITFTKSRISVFWGEFSQVEAILVLIRTAMSNAIKFDRFVLLSGADYPVKTFKYIEDLFENNTKTEYINLIAMPADNLNKPISRLNRYVLPYNSSKFSKVLRKVLVKIRVIRNERNYKKYLGDIKPYGGSTWWALTREACKQIICFIDKETKIVNFFKNTVCPDECIIHTIIGNSPLSSNVSRSPTYSDWSKGGASPLNISEAHLNFFKTNTSFPHSTAYGSGEMLFARKFQDNSDDLILKLNEQIHNV